MKTKQKPIVVTKEQFAKFWDKVLGEYPHSRKLKCGMVVSIYLHGSKTPQTDCSLILRYPDNFGFSSQLHLEKEDLLALIKMLATFYHNEIEKLTEVRATTP